jgi:hypothetical protein
VPVRPRLLPALLAVAVVVTVGAPAAVAADTLVTFQTPSHKIGCAYMRLAGERPSLRCDVADLKNPANRPASCELDYGSAFGLGLRGRAQRLCVGDTVLDPKASVLAYGRTRRLGSFTCVSRTTGLRCTSPSGHGFELAHARQRLF